MREMAEIMADERVRVSRRGPDGMAGEFYDRIADRWYSFILSDGLGWDHVSVSRRHVTPTWDVMCLAREVFFRPEECVVQYHPPVEDYVNRHPHCLHLWRPQGAEVPRPARVLV